MREFEAPKTGITRARLRYRAALKKAGPMVIVTMYLMQSRSSSQLGFLQWVVNGCTMEILLPEHILAIM